MATVRTAQADSGRLNPLLKIRWDQVGMLSFDENELTISTRGGGLQRFVFATKAELDAAFTEWIMAGKDRGHTDVAQRKTPAVSPPKSIPAIL